MECFSGELLPCKICDRLHQRKLHPAQSHGLQDKVGSIRLDWIVSNIIDSRSRGLFTSSTNPLEVLLGRTTWAVASAEEGERVSDIEDEDDLVKI